MQQREDGSDACSVSDAGVGNDDASGSGGGAGGALVTFNDLDDIEAALRALYVEGRNDGDFLVRFLGTQGEPGMRCLTLNLELRNAYYEEVRDSIEEIVGRIRRTGFTVDELLQRVAEEPRFDVRFWLLIYETEIHEKAHAS